VTAHDRPTPAELVEAAREFLEEEVLALVEDRRLRFHLLVALNALGIAQRELTLPDEGGLTRDELADLAHRIRAGDVPEDALALLKEHVAGKLRVASPRYLDRYEDRGQSP
jgi:hypothetical protein